MRMNKFPQYATMVIFLLVGIGFCWWAWASWSATRQFQANAERTEGTILGYQRATSDSKEGSSGTSRYPRIGYADRQGNQRELNSNLAVDPEEYPVGDAISVIYDPGSQEARLDSFWNLEGDAFILGFFGLLSLGSGLLVLFLVIRQAPVRAENVVMSGFAVSALLLALVAWSLSGDSLYLVGQGVRVEATVVNAASSPLVEYVAANGRTYHRQSHVSDSESTLAPGDKLPLLYDPAHPGKSRIDSFDDLWFPTALTGGFALMCLVISLGLLVLKLRKRSLQRQGLSRKIGPI